MTWQEPFSSSKASDMKGEQETGVWDGMPNRAWDEEQKGRWTIYCTLPETNSSPPKIGRATKGNSSCNPSVSCDMLVSGRVMNFYSPTFCDLFVIFLTVTFDLRLHQIEKMEIKLGMSQVLCSSTNVGRTLLLGTQL